MHITCKSCGTALKIKDRDVSPEQVLWATCPKCKEKIKIDTRHFKDQQVLMRKELIEKTKSNDEEFSSPIDFIGEGIRLALVLVKDTVLLNDINRALNDLSFKPVESSSMKEAIDRLRLHHFDLIILSDGFDGQDLNNNPIMNYLNSLSMSLRRRMFIVLLGDKFKTMDEMQAFRENANLVVNKADIPKMTLILKKAISDKEKFYAVFMDIQRETGKS